ncbi:MAG: 1-acyl-sn-glycerol-3-phosphate acyltransferase, partial [Acidobacteriota bacterium]
HPGLVTESHRSRRADRTVTSQRWRRLEAEIEAAVDYLDSAPALTILRPTAVPLVDGDDLLSRLVNRRVACCPAGFDPMLQLLALGDLVTVLQEVMRRGGPAGTFHVAPPTAIPLRRMLRLAGVRRLGLPFTRLGLGARGGRDDADRLRHPSTVSGERLKDELELEITTPSARVAERLGVEHGRRQAAEELADDDVHGFDPAYVRRLGKTLFRFLHDRWWRIEVRGIEHLPRDGAAVLAGVHRGHQPWDGVMTLHHLGHHLGRFPRFLIHPTLVKFPFLAPAMIRCGGVHACRENADRLLDDGEILGIYPEGVRGAFALYRDAYRLGKFGRDEFVRFALRHGAPIVPYVIVGSAEIFPILGRIDAAWWRRWSEWPFLPITPTMSLIPLPSKWHIWFLEPISVAEHGPSGAEDPAIVRALSDETRRRMEAAMLALRDRRPAIFWGSVFDDPSFPASVDELLDRQPGSGAPPPQ